MNAYDLSQLIRLWEQEKVTSEQVIGQILLHVRTLTERVAKLERTRPIDSYSSSSNSPTVDV